MSTLRSDCFLNEIEVLLKNHERNEKEENRLTASRRRLRYQVCLIERYRTANKREFSRISFQSTFLFFFLGLFEPCIFRGEK